MDIQSQDILDFWLDEIGPQGWYRQDDDIDQRIRDRFMDAWHAARRNELECWSIDPRRCLALIILLDQFPRNMFRGSARAFHSDARALSVAAYALGRGWDLRIEGPERQFFYMPYMHSEHLPDQDHCVRLFAERMPGDNLLHARVHREIIRRFGRFPYRNAALGRRTTAAEQAFLDGGGYGGILNELKGD